MKNKVIGILSTLLICSTAIANDEIKKPIKGSTSKIETKIDSSKSKLHTRNGWEVGVGFYQLNNSYEDGGTESLNGISLVGSKDFKLSSNFSTKTTFSMSDASNKNSEAEFDTDTDYSHSSISQNISYSTEKYGVLLKPFLSYGIGSGDYKQSTDGLSQEDQNSLGIKRFSTKAVYTTQVTSIGLQVIFENGISPFISYEITSIAFKEVSTSISKSGTKDKVNISYDLNDTKSKAVVAGLLYVF